MQRPKLSGDRVQSRWWYWIAAVPVVFVFWVVTVAWVAFAISLEPNILPSTYDSPIVHAALVSLVAVGIPFAVLIAVFPFAVFQDTQAIHRAEQGWEPPSGNYALTGLLGLAAAVVVWLLTSDISSAVIAGFVLSVPFALYYLRERHDNLGVP
ncbi:hypothetical protein BG842_26375 [Haladaptatus sp. W1]|uniref:hypothetical protein n=1 Tax=unclassified Haladaptatus TaxID=2622732 RepID=UPI0008496EB1|nr:MULTISPECIES: hypothetical protein [unclassified Haladaptatus]ODR81590.1 hypothetical protein BG842_26375 [Haladaptatus sp. W1]GKZ14825.1 hypothetical protein HAL_27060 [Haladaptatus sp. T7]